MKYARITPYSVFLGLVLVGCGVEESVADIAAGPPPPSTDQPADPGPPAPPEEPPLAPPDEPTPPEEPAPPEGPGFEECATQYDAAVLKPLDMVVMLDRSGSMLDDGKWGAVTTAMQQFAANPASDGIGVSLGYFPQPYSSVCAPCNSSCAVCFNNCCAPPTGEFCWNDSDCDSGGICYDFMCRAGGGNASCDIGDYADPEVPLADLPGAAGQLNISMANATPNGGTPTGPALAGALDYASALAALPDANDVVVVLATDGEPTECQPQGIGDVASIAAAAATAVHPIATYVIGVGTNTFNLNVIAAAGGTQQAALVDADANATQNFLATLNEIRRVAVACQYAIPDVNGTILYDLVNVAYATDGQTLTAINNVAGPTACTLNGGWYYDDPSAPTSIVMCPTTCEQMQSGDGTQVEIVYGCETIVE